MLNRTGESGFAHFLTGDWRLVYTTGTKKTETDVGRINYVPITAVQRFDMDKKFIRNGVYLGPVSLEFEGTLRWIEERRRMEFDFEERGSEVFCWVAPSTARGVGVSIFPPEKRSRPNKKTAAVWVRLKIGSWHWLVVF
ncbi:unnamed protein product [Effrenium voratum]|nr:unnamed protein product [Effrenium voratum]